MQVEMLVRGVKRGWALLPGAPDAFISSVSHDDAATAVVAALSARAGAYNISDDEPVSRAEYFRSLASALGVPPPRFVPRWMSLAFGSMGELLSRSERISNRKFRDETGWRPRFPSVLEGWAAMFGPEPPPMRESARDTASIHD
jgi:nucleoside-diphosphate-sugar epimerase